MCDYCGEKDHTLPKCAMMEKLKPNVAISQVTPISRTRTRRVCSMSFAEILYDNHIVSKSNMKENVDLFVKTHFHVCGIVDQYALADHIFSSHPINPMDRGHLAVVGYIIARYCDVTIDSVKKFLRELCEYNDDRFVTRSLLSKWNISVFHKNGDTHFRKFVGTIV